MSLKKLFKKPSRRSMSDSSEVGYLNRPVNPFSGASSDTSSEPEVEATTFSVKVDVQLDIESRRDLTSVEDIVSVALHFLDHYEGSSDGEYLSTTMLVAVLPYAQRERLHEDFYSLKVRYSGCVVVKALSQNLPSREWDVDISYSASHHGAPVTVRYQISYEKTRMPGVSPRAIYDRFSREKTLSDLLTLFRVDHIVDGCNNITLAGTVQRS